MAKNGRLFTKTQEKILAVLADGMPHTREELRKCFDDGSGVPLSGLQQLNNNLTAIRKVIRPLGQEILCQYKSRFFYYRHVRLLHGPED
jgi:hypothetical protein